MSIVIVHGPQGSGKTFNAERFLKHYGCTQIIEWDFRQTLKDGDLALTNSKPPFYIPGALVVDIETAKCAIR